MFIAWTVHLEYESQMLAFLLDIIEVAEVCVSKIICLVSNANVILQSHTGAAMAKAFQDMLLRFELTDKVTISFMPLMFAFADHTI